MSYGKVITMSSLGKNGRFGNQFFQYAFLKCLSNENQCSIELPDWGGREIFELNDPYISRKLPRVYELSNDTNRSLITQLDGKLYNCDLWGWFQFHTSYYQPYKSYISKLFPPNEFYKAECSMILNQLFKKGTTIVSIHLRRGDADAKGPYFYAPTFWYSEWLKSIWTTLEKPVLYIASDDPDSVVADFKNYNPYTLSDFYNGSDKHSYYFDFYILQNYLIVLKIF